MQRCGGRRRAARNDSRTVHQDSRTVDVHISRIRHKLGPLYGQCLVTEYRAGYQFRGPAPGSGPPSRDAEVYLS